MRGEWSKATVFAHRGLRWIRFHSDKGNIVQIELQQIDRFLHQVAVLVANMLELFGGYADVERTACDVTVTGGLQPGFKGLAIHLLFEGCQDLYPGVNRRCGRSCK